MNHERMMGGLENILQSQELLPGVQGTYGIGGEAVRAYTYRINELWHGGGQAIEFMTPIKPNIGPSMAGEAATWTVGQELLGGSLPIRVLKVYHPDGSITLYVD
jgi:hypothetical protein